MSDMHIYIAINLELVTCYILEMMVLDLPETIILLDFST